MPVFCGAGAAWAVIFRAVTVHLHGIILTPDGVFRIMNARSLREENGMDKWDRRFMEMAHVIAGWTSCFMPGRSIGCVIVKDKRIMTTGYNGAPAGLKTCKERGE